MISQSMWPRVLALELVLLIAAGASGCEKKQVQSGSIDGREVFATACARCHGSNGVPEPTRAARLGVRDLTSSDLQSSLGDDDIRRRILEGSANGRMPGFAGKLAAEQVDALVVYIRTLAAN